DSRVLRPGPRDRGDAHDDDAPLRQGTRRDAVRADLRPLLADPAYFRGRERPCGGALRLRRILRVHVPPGGPGAGAHSVLEEEAGDGEVVGLSQGSKERRALTASSK